MDASQMPAWASSGLSQNYHKRLGIVAIALLVIGCIFLSLLCLGISPESAVSSITSGFDDSFGLWGDSTRQAIWLIATMSPVQGVARRSIIRSTWQRMYSNETLFNTVFFLARPPLDWVPIIEAENSTYGDLVVLDDIEETHDVATHTKPFEFYKWLVQQERQWPFVSKADDDAFVDPIRFSNKYLEPLLAESREHDLPPIVIGRRIRNRKQYDAPAGQLITMTWDTIEHLVRLHEENPVTDDEDALVGRLLHEGHVDSRFIHLESKYAFDYWDDVHGETINGVQTAWAPDGADLSVDNHGVGPGSIVPHKMKTDDAYLRVAACFGPEGVLKKEEATKGIRESGH